MSMLTGNQDCDLRWWSVRNCTETSGIMTSRKPIFQKQQSCDRVQMCTNGALKHLKITLNAFLPCASVQQRLRCLLNQQKRDASCAIAKDKRDEFKVRWFLKHQNADWRRCVRKTIHHQYQPTWSLHDKRNAGSLLRKRLCFYRHSFAEFIAINIPSPANKDLISLLG